MQKVYQVEVYEPSLQAIVKNTHTNEFICRVHFTDHDTDEKAIKLAKLIAEQLNVYLDNL